MGAADQVEALAARIRPLVAGEEGLTERRMFGGIAFLINGNMAVSASGQGGLMLRCDPAATDQLLGRGGVERVVMRGRSMDGWLRVEMASLTAAGQLADWVRVGIGFARTLPPK